jgi:transmembrane sensor
MKKTNLDRLLQRYIAGQVTEQEKKKIEAWLDVKKTDEGSDMVLNEQDEEKLFRKITTNIDNVEEIKAFRPGAGKARALFSSRWLQIAATLLILMAASYAVWLIAGRDTVYETITHANAKKAILKDGTIVWLEEESRLTYINNGAIRQATLEGEGLFEVAKDPSRPFVISCGAVNLRVVGTSFHLRSRNQGVELKVLTGKVSVSAANQEPIEVASNEVALYGPAGEIRKAALDNIEREAITATTEYNMAFRNTVLENVIDRIERKFDTEVTIEDPHVNTCRITADFTDHSLESTLEMISEFLEIEYRISKNAVTLTGAGCP